MAAAARGPNGALTAKVVAPHQTGLAGLGAFALANLQAAAKAGDICARGFRLLNTASIGSAWMTVDDTIAEMQGRMSCANLGEMLALESEIHGRCLVRLLRRVSVLTRMAGQLAEDALVPLQRRIGANIETLGNFSL